MSSLVVTGCGLVTAVGLNLRQTACAVRAGIAHFVEVPVFVDRQGRSVIAAPLMEVALGDGRWPWRLVRAVCEEAIPAEYRRSVSGRAVNVTLLGGEPHRTAWPIDPRIGALIQGALGGASGGLVTACPQGNAALVAAMNDAQGRLEKDPDAVELLVAADSWLDPDVLGRVELAGRLKSAARPRGLIPGEAVGCVVVESSEAAVRHKRQALARISAVGLNHEPSPVGSDTPCLGEGLTAAVAQALQSRAPGGDQVNRVLCDLNGEEYRVHEWMLARTRTLTADDVVHPADCFGDIGAAFGPALVGLAAVTTDQAPAMPVTLVFLSSDSGLRGSLCIEPAGW